jgi:tetratricopeptide (TPR) repeat protein
VRLLEALARFLEGAAAEGGALIFDDLQWCDEPSLSVLAHLLQRRRVRVFAAYRPLEATTTLQAMLDGLRRAGLLELIRLDPLDLAGVERLMASLTGRERGPPVFSRWLWQRAGGNPMFTLETLRALFEGGVLSADEGGWSSAIDDLTQDYSELEVPAAVSQVIERRVARLSEGTVRVLRAAAVAGPEIDSALLIRVAGLSAAAVLTALSEAEEGGLLLGERFAHDLVRQSVYASLGTALRYALHAGVAEHLPPSTDPSIRAEHWLAARQLPAAVEAWLEAVEAMRAKGLFDAAVLLLQRGIDRCDDPLLRQRLEARLIDVLQQSGRNAEALVRSAALLESSDRPELRASAYNARALVQLRQGQVEAAAESVAAGQNAFRQVGAGPESASFVMTRAILHHAQGDYDATIALLEPLATDLRLAPSTDDFGTVLTSLAAAYDMRGEHLKALPLHWEALGFVKVQGYRYFQVDAALNLLYCLMDLGRADEGLSEGEAALELGHFENSPTLRSNLATAYFELDRYDDARRHYRQVVESSEHDFLLAIAWARLAETEHRLGQKAAVPAAVEQAIVAAEGTDFQLARARVLIAALERGTAEQAARVRPWLTEIDLAGLPEYVRDEITALS